MTGRPTDRPIVEVAAQLDTSEVGARVRLVRARRRAMELISGLEGVWVMEETKRRDDIPRHLSAGGYEATEEVVLDDLKALRSLRTELQLQNGRFALTNRGEHLDHGAFRLAADRLELRSDGYRGSVTHVLSLEGDRLMLRQLVNRNPEVHGVPDAAFQHVLLNFGWFAWRPATADVPSAAERPWPRRPSPGS